MTVKVRKGFPAFLILVILLSIKFNSFAQVNIFSAPDLSRVKIESISDRDLEYAYEVAINQKYNIAQILKMVTQKGLPQKEVEVLEDRLNSLVLEKEKNEQVIYSGEREEHRYNSEEKKVPMISQPVDPTIFGSELFAENSLVFEPNLRIPPPANYMLGPDDEIIIYIYGYSEKKYSLLVKESGEIYIPNVGLILVSGLTIEQATAKIKDKLGNTIYTAIQSGKTKVEVNLGKIRSIRVTIIGQAKKPGTYTVSSLTTLYNALYLCGGPTKMGSYREIEVIRGSKRKSADLYDFLVYGNKIDNLLLQEGDVVRIPYYRNRVTISGNIKREGKFEMLDGETFSDLLIYTGGFTDAAYRGAVTVTRITDSVRRIIDLPSGQYESFYIRGSDKYLVRQLQNEFGNRIYVSGAIQRPGPYELTPNLTVEGLIEKAGGLTPDAYLQRALIYRYSPNKLPAMESVNLDSVFNKDKNIYLQRNDSLVISSLFSLKDKYHVTVQGEVRIPGNLIWRKNMTLKDVLLASGGITGAGDLANIEISRRIENVNVSKLNHIESEIIIVNLTENDNQRFYLEPHDIILVKGKPGYSIQRTVLIRGEILSPGRYSLRESKTKISDIIRRAGGFRASADSSSLTLRRMSRFTMDAQERKDLFKRLLNISEDSLRENPILRNELYKSYEIINIDLDKALSNPQSSANLALEDGDILTVSRGSNLIKISGEVYFPTIVAYQPGKNLKYYVEQAGDFMPNARKSGALVIQPDGKIKTVKHFLFFKIYPEIEPRSEVFVPRKERSNRSNISTGELALIISALGIVANVIINASN